MDIEEFKRKKRQMELEIFSVANEAINKFYNNTTYSPRNIEFDLFPVKEIGSRDYHYILVDVKSTVDI